MYFTLGLRNPTPVDFLTDSDYTRPEQVQEVIRALAEYRVRFVMVNSGLEFPTGRHH